jgi:hypothetical protein
LEKMYTLCSDSWWQDKWWMTQTHPLIREVPKDEYNCGSQTLQMHNMVMSPTRSLTPRQTYSLTVGCKETWIWSEYFQSYEIHTLSWVRLFTLIWLQYSSVYLCHRLLWHTQRRQFVTIFLLEFCTNSFFITFAKCSFMPCSQNSVIH